jgi:hypothetical protein
MLVPSSSRAAQPQSPVMKGQKFSFGPVWPPPQGLSLGLRPTFLQTTLTDQHWQQFNTHVDMVWWHHIFDPFLESIRPWHACKGLNFCKMCNLHFWNRHHQIIPKHLFSVYPYDCQMKVHNLAACPMVYRGQGVFYGLEGHGAFWGGGGVDTWYICRFVVCHWFVTGRPRKSLMPLVPLVVVGLSALTLQPWFRNVSQLTSNKLFLPSPCQTATARWSTCGLFLAENAYCYYTGSVEQLSWVRCRWVWQPKPQILLSRA